MAKRRIDLSIIFFKAAILVCFFIASHTAHAADSTWTGAISSDWGTAGNWSLNAVPNSTTNVTIPDASTTINDPSISATAAAANVIINASGILNGNAGILSVYGGWTNSGVFNHGSGKVIFRGGTNTTFTPGNSDYYDLELNKTNYDDISVSGTANVLGDFTQTDGELQGGQINLSGDYIIGAASNGSSTYNSSTVINLNHATNDQQIIYNAGGVGAQLRIDKAGGTVNISANIVVCGWSYIQGTVVGLDTYTLIFGDDYNGTFTPGSLVYQNIEVKKTGYDTIGVSGTGTIAGNITHTSGEFQGGQLNLAGNYIVGPAAEGGSIYGTSTVINFNHASNDQTIVFSTGGVAAQVRIDKAGGTFAVNDNIVVCGWTYIQGTVTGLDTHTLIFGDNYNGSFTPGNLVYSNIELNKTGYDNLAISGTAIVAGNVTHTNGEFGGGQINLSGDYIIGANAKGGADSSVPTVMNFNGTGDQGILYTAGGTGTTVHIDKPSGIFSVPDSVATSSWHYIQGTVAGISSCSLKLGDDYHNSFTPGNLVYNNIEIRETGGYENFTLSGNLNMDGDLNFTRGNLRLNTNNPSINLGGDLSISAGTTFTKGSGTITFVGTAPSTFTDLSVTAQNIGNVAVNKTSLDESQNKLTLLSDMTCNTLIVDGTANQSDTLDLGMGSHTLTFANAGAVSSVFTQNGDTIPGNSTVKYLATNSAGSINIAPTDYNNLQLAGNETYLLTGTASLGGDLIIGSTSVLNAGSSSLSLSGDFSNQGSFIPGIGSVNLNGSDQSVSGDNSFYNLAKDTDISDTLTFAAGSTTTILTGGSLILTGGDRDNRLSLRSSVADTSWNLNVASGATSTLDYLDVADSNLTGEALTVLNSLSSDGNTNWTIINNTAPEIASLNISRNGSLVTVRAVVSDIDQDAVSIKVEYSTDNGSTWGDPYLASPSATIGYPILNNIGAYQISDIATTDANTITFVWDTKSEQNERGDILLEDDVKIRITPNDGSDLGSAISSAAFEVNNSPVAFIPSIDLDFSSLAISSSQDTLNFSDLPSNITQIAVSVYPDFRDSSFQDISIPIISSIYDTRTLYLKFRTAQGATSGVITYTKEDTVSVLQDGDIVKTADSFDVYIIKIKNNKLYRRLILSPSVFNSYQHLRWENLKIISQQRLDQYAISNLVRETDDIAIYELISDGDMGSRRIVDISKPYDPDSVYEINAVDRDSYRLAQ